MKKMLKFFGGLVIIIFLCVIGLIYAEYNRIQTDSKVKSDLVVQYSLRYKPGEELYLPDFQETINILSAQAGYYNCNLNIEQAIYRGMQVTEYQYSKVGAPFKEVVYEMDVVRNIMILSKTFDNDRLEWTINLPNNDSSFSIYFAGPENYEDFQKLLYQGNWQEGSPYFTHVAGGCYQ